MSLVRHHNLIISPAQKIIWWGSGGPFESSPSTLIPPANMRAGDLVYVWSAAGGGSLRTLTITNAGGQSWTSIKTRDGNASLPSVWETFCTFNGTWSANPVFSIDGSTVSKTNVMHVFRPPKIGATWVRDQGPLQLLIASTGSGVYTLAAIVNTLQPNVSIFSINVGINWLSTAGAGWQRLGAAQYSAGGANARTSMHAYKIQGYKYPVGDTGNCVITTDQSSSGHTTRSSFSFV